ncbi:MULTISPECIES: AtpZ/AtpI family protein [Campylobacter]|uniref:AtpZ/AtpI family protein n=1 Tax=Campylobacter TaxID=194 RepID=UPI0023F16226|nr:MULTISPECIES: AtpZ/AtpI family protein [Campylobacter]MCI6641705.1 AtpZ/AtpI family protein [Campylobacter sp.]MDD7422903.1 AtpZ/AtpI family protein [Campylobacter hominis]MDY3117294.1 AtpZ/AtpI family protein [Campylobacter hominis]
MKPTENLNKIVRGADALSLGISIVVAILIGVGLGIWLKKLTGSTTIFIVCVIFGVLAAILNVYKSFKMLQNSLKELEDDPKYKNYKFDDEDDE